MTLKEAYEQRRQESLALKRQVKKLEKELEKASSGLFTPDEKVYLIKQVNKLTRQLKAAEKERDRYHDMWEMGRKRNLTYDFERLDLADENTWLKQENDLLKQELRILTGKVAFLESHNDPDADAKIRALSDEVARLTAIINNDGGNSGTPTSKTPINKNKVIPNSREKTGRKKGGQPGHEKHTLHPIPDEEVNDTQTHALDICPECGGELEVISCRNKDEIDYEVRVINST